MMKLIPYIFILFPLLGLGQNHAGRYFGTVEKDTIGRVDITIELNKDSTYEMTAQFDYYGIYDGHCFDGETWKYFGTWLSYKEYIFFKPCKENYELISDSTDSCVACCDFPNSSFDFMETYKTSEEIKSYNKKKWSKIFNYYKDLGYGNQLKIDPINAEIYFHFAWDCHEEIWDDNSVKKVE